MQDNKFLLTFYDNEYFTYSYGWYEDEDEMRDAIKLHPEWNDLDAIEIIDYRNIEI